MLNRAIIPVDDATLAISEPNAGTRLWLLGLHFDNGLADIDLVSLADTETITIRVDRRRADGRRHSGWHVLPRVVGGKLVVSW